eukprot:CAMPEP_0113721270 /NCGR_PEP_ID=MMETSP0038_2-20120614/37028_1 /TAXON_ID=2898 /ORGANISM="Cryptomonas paramecium" /LENGTH=83 /DNA_ID=CAMNT_0000650237 /DNA_START=85 /DNA_END=336 /DNA_ORIENTATION=- /assembly_acc=CAM_ASM_000170
MVRDHARAQANYNVECDASDSYKIKTPKPTNDAAEGPLTRRGTPEPSKPWRSLRGQRVGKLLVARASAEVSSPGACEGASEVV